MGSLEYIEGEQIYKTTEKGTRFLKIYNQIGEYVGSRRVRKEVVI